ncbi:MAG: hypothetical protein IIU74_02115 [Ruminiclostridium sp.]|nr:hypothetical protein [Ruminiclostridium sp.]
MLPVNPEAIGVFGLFATVICFGLEQVGVGVKGADHEKLTRTLGYIAIIFGGVCQLYTSVSMFLFSVGGDHSKYLGTVFGFFGLFWILVGLFFLKGGDKKVMAHFFFCALILVVLFTVRAFADGLIWPLGIDCVVIDILLISLIFGWYTENPKLGKLAGLCNIAIGAISFFLLYPHVLG